MVNSPNLFTSASVEFLTVPLNKSALATTITYFLSARAFDSQSNPS